MEAPVRATVQPPREHFDALFSILHDAVMFGGYPDRCIHDANDAFLRLFRTTRDAAIGSTTESLHVDAERHARFGEVMARAFSTGQPAVVEWPLRRADGTTFLAEVTLSPATKNGRAGFVGIVRDVTARAQQREIERRRGAMGDALSGLARMLGGTFEDDVRRVVETAAVALGARRTSVWLYSATRDSIECVDLYDLAARVHTNGATIRATEAPRYFAALEEARIIDASDARTDPRTTEFVEGYLDPLGITSMLDAPIRIGGRAVGVVCHEHVGPQRAWLPEEAAFAATMADLVANALQARDLVATRAELAHGQKMAALGSLVGGVAHEIRTPLAYLSNNLALLDRQLARLAETLPENDAARLRGVKEGALADAQSAVHRINRLVEDLRRFTRREPSERAMLRLDLVVQEATDLFRAAHRGDLRVEADLAPVAPRMLDRIQLQQVVLNLLENAREAAPRDAAVRVRVHQASAGAVLEVSDRGPGIPDDVVPRIFDPFFTTKPEGTGLGLAIVRRIVDAHGASLQCETRAGEGTTFRVTFR